MPERTYKVAEVLGSREWAPANDPSKMTVFWDFKAEGVDQVCNIGRKPGNDLKVGDVFAATATEDRGKLKLKRVNPQGGGGGKDYKADPAKLRGEAMRSAIHAASSYVTAMAEIGRVPEGFTYPQMDPMIRHFYALIVEAMGE